LIADTRVDEWPGKGCDIQYDIADRRSNFALRQAEPGFRQLRFCGRQLCFGNGEILLGRVEVNQCE